MIVDGLWDVYEDFHMGMTPSWWRRNTRSRGRGRTSLPSRAIAKRYARSNPVSSSEQIVPVEIPSEEGRAGDYQDGRIAARRCVARSTRQAAARVQKGWHGHGRQRARHERWRRCAVVVTSEQTAHRLGKTPMARIVAQAVSGVDPKWVMMAPVDAVEMLLKKTGWDRDKDVDLYELNEAFAVAAIAVTRELKLNPEKVNVNGGAVALGHPIGASGARVLVTLLYELQRRNLKRGIAALCLGGGNAVALAIERF